MTFKPHHVALTVNNIDESVKWFQEKLGFEVTHRYKKETGEIIHIKRDQVRIELFCLGDTRLLPDYRKDLMSDLHTVGTKHLCIEVENLDNTIDALKKKGVEFVTEVDTAGFGGRFIFFKDCNGILIELYQS